MQINGLREFLAKFMPSLHKVAGPHQNSVPNFSGNTDTVDVSEVGKNLSFNLTKLEKNSSFPESGDVERTQLTGNVRASSSDPLTDSMDSSFTRMEEILEEMNALAVKAAEDDSLNELDRMSMQIRMEDLRMELYNTSRSINDKLAEMSGYGGMRDEVAHEPADNIGVLERALMRIDKGEPWDVAEGWRKYYRTTEVTVLNEATGEERTIKPDDDGMITLDLGEDEKIVNRQEELADIEAYVLEESERYIMLYDEDGKPIDEDKDGKPDFFRIPSVRDKLEASGTIILMDAESAKEGVKLLEYELEKYQAMRKEFDEFKADPQRNRSLTAGELSSLNAEYESMQADLRAKQEAGKESRATKLFLTEIGIMKTDGAGNNPRLVYTAGPKGAMFAKLDRFFRGTQNIFSKDFVDESLENTDFVLNSDGSFRWIAGGLDLHTTDDVIINEIWKNKPEERPLLL